MIYAFVFALFFQIYFGIRWMQSRRKLFKMRRELKFVKEHVELLRKNNSEIHKEIWILIDGGLIQQETVIMKYRKQREDAERMNRAAMNAFRQNRSMGLSELGGLHRIFNANL